MLIQDDTFSRTHCFALEPSTFKLEGDFIATVKGLRFQTEKSVASIAYGFFSIADFRNGLDPKTGYEDVLNGDSWSFSSTFKWNDYKMWSVSENFREEMKVWEMLDPIFRQSVVNGEFVNEPNLGILPGNFEGWFKRKKS